MNEATCLTKSSTISVDAWPLVTLHLNTQFMPELLIDLQKKIYQAPLFFKSAPLILSFSEQEENLDLDDLQTLLSFLEQYHCRPIGWVGPAWVEPIAEFFKCPYWPSTVPTGRSDFAKIISEPVRAGQSVYHPGDIIVMAPCHESSELLAGGNIHCYAPVDGRLLAGIRGNKEARIFCLSLSAQLISIAGLFQTFEQYKKIEGPVQIALSHNTLKISELHYE